MDLAGSIQAVTNGSTTTYVLSSQGQAMLLRGADAAAEVSGVSKAEIVRLIDPQAEQTARAISQIDSSVLASITPTVAAMLSPQQVSRLTGQQMLSLSAEVLSAVSADAVTAWQQSTGLNLVDELMADVHQASKVSQLTQSQLQVSLPAQPTADLVLALSPSAIRGIPPSAIAQLSTSAVDNLSPSQLRALSEAQIQAFSSVQLQALDQTQLEQMLPRQVMAMTAQQFSALGANQSHLAAGGALRSLPPDLVAEVLPQVFGSVPVTQLVNLTSSQIQNLSVPQLAGMSARQIELLTQVNVDDAAIAPFFDVVRDAIGQLSQPVSSWSALGNAVTPVVTAISTVVAVNAGQNTAISVDNLVALGFTSSLSGNQLGANLQLAQTALARAETIDDAATLDHAITAVEHLYDQFYGQNTTALTQQDCDVLGITVAPNTLGSVTLPLITQMLADLAPANGAQHAQAFVAATEINNLVQAAQPSSQVLLTAGAAVTLGFAADAQNVDVAQAQDLILALWQENSPVTVSDRLDLLTAAADFYQFAYAGENAASVDLTTLQALGFAGASVNNLSAYSSYLKDAVASLDLIEPAALLADVQAVDRLYEFISSQGAQDQLTAQDLLALGFATGTPNSTQIQTIKAAITSEIQGGDSLISEIRQAFGDITPPSVSISASASSLNAAQTANLTFTLSEPSTDFAQSDVTVSGGALSNWTATSASVYTAVFTPAANSTTSASVAVASNRFSDAAGNFNTDGADANNTVTLGVDTVLPTVAIASSVNALTSGQTANLTFTLSEASSDFSLADVTVSGGALSNWTASSATVYTAMFTPAANSTANGVIAVASNRFSDAAGNFNADGADANNTATLSVNTNSAPSAPPSNSAIAAWLTSFQQVYAGKSATDAYVALMQSPLLSLNQLSIFNGSLTNTPYAFQSAIASAVRNVLGGLTLPPNTPSITLNNPTEQEITALLASRQTTINSNLSSFASTVAGMTSSNASALSSLVSNLTADVYASTLANPNYQSGMQGNTPTYTLPYVAANARAYLLAFQATGWASNPAAPTLAEIQAVITSENNRFFNAALTELREDAAGNANQALIGSNLLSGVYSALRPGLSFSTVSTPLRTYLNANVNGQSTSNDVANLIDTFRTQAGQSYADLVEQAISTNNASLISNYTSSLSDFFSGASSWTMAGTGSALWTRTTTALMRPQNYADPHNITSAEISAVLNQLSNDYNSASSAFSSAYSGRNFSAITTNQWQILLNNVSTSSVAAYTTALLDTQASQYSMYYSNGQISNVQKIIDTVNAGTYTAPFNPFSVNNPSNPNTPQQPQQPQQPLDTTPPTVTITSSRSSLARGESATLTFTMSESVTGFDLSDVWAASAFGTLSNFSGSGTTYTATYTPLDNVSSQYNTISVDAFKFRDAANNDNRQNASLTLPVDTYPPFTATISAGPTARSVYVTFSEAVGGSPNDRYFVVSGATYEWGSSSRDTQYQGPGTRWIVGVWPIQGASGNVTVEFNQNNPLSSSRGAQLSALPAAYTFAMDATPPTLSVTTSRASIDAPNQSSTFTFTFSEAVTGFDINDLVLGYNTQFSTNWNDTNNQIPDATGYNFLSFTNNTYLSNFTQVSSSVYTVDLTAPANLAKTIKIKLKESNHQISDAAGNQYAHNGSYPPVSLAEVAVDTDTRALTLVREVQGGASKSAWDYSAVGITLGQGSEAFVNAVLQTAPQVQTNLQAKQAATGLYNLYMHAIGNASWYQIPEPTTAQLTAIGITGINTAQKVTSLISIIRTIAHPDSNHLTAIDSRSELQAFADLVNDSTPPVITYSSLSIERFSGANLTPSINELTSEIYLLPASYPINSLSDLDGNAISNYRFQNQGFEYQSWTNQQAGALTLNNVDSLPVGQYKLYAVDLAGNYTVSNANIAITATPASVSVSTPGTVGNTAQVSINTNISGVAYLANASITNFDTTYNPYAWNDPRTLQSVNVSQSGAYSFNLGWLNSGTYRLWFKTPSGAWSSDASNLITVDADAPTITLQSTQGIETYDIYKSVAPGHTLAVKLNEVGTIKLYNPANPSSAVEVQYTASDLASHAYKSISFSGLPAGNNSYSANNYLLMVTDQYGNQNIAGSAEGLSTNGIRIDAFAPDTPNMTVSGSTVNVTGVNDVLSGETAYLIKTGETMANASDIQALVAANKAVQVSGYTAATQWVGGSGSFVTSNLVEGTYRGYAVDTFGNISTAATNSSTYQIQEFVKDLTAPVISYSQFNFTRGNGQYLAITSNEGGSFYVVPDTVTVHGLQDVLSSNVNSFVDIVNNNPNNSNASRNNIISGTNSHYIYNSTSLTAGNYYVYVADAAGNVSTVPSTYFHVI